jgi:uncharacterized membrane protein YkoI
MLSKVRKTALALAALGAIAFGASAIAGAADNGSSNSKSSGSATQQNSAAPQQNTGAAPRQHPGETLLAGDTAEKVRAAALKKVPGATIIRVETDAEGSPYEAHMRKSDGSEVTVKVDKDFSATSVEDFGGPGGPDGPGGPGGHGGPPPASNGSGSSSGTSSGASFQTTYQ